jgi:LysR family glycine cleavage system transcriptional activator
LNIPRRLPPLNALRAFEAAARLGSFKEAADEICVSNSAISHQVKNLENYLGIGLFERVARGVELTRAGRGYYLTVRAAFERITEGTEQILSLKVPGELTVQVYSTFTVRWLIPRLPTFQSLYPNLMVRLLTSQLDVDFEREETDLAVMIGNPSNKNVHYDFLFSCRIFPVCSPGLFNSGMELSDPQDLVGQQIIQVYPSDLDWRTWLDDNKVLGVDPNAGLRLDSYDLAWYTASQGLGVALGMEPFVNRELESGALLEPFPGRRVYPRGDWYLACRIDKSDRPEIRIFRDWLLHEVHRDKSMPQSRRD